METDLVAMPDSVKPALASMHEEIKPVLELMPDWMSDPIIVKLFEAVIGIVIILFVSRMISKVLSRKVQQSENRYRIRKAATFFSYFIIVIFLVGLFSENLGKISVFFGVVGAGIAFALQEVIASFAGWVAVSFGQFYKPGDRVLLGGIMGDVIDISILRTTLMECGGWVHGDLYNGRIVRIANSFVFKEPVFNYSADFSFVWDEIILPVKYGSDRKLARHMILSAAQEIASTDIANAQIDWQIMAHKYMLEHASLEPTVTLIANDNWLEYTLRYVVSYKQRRSMKDRLFNRILDDFDASDNKVSMASATFHLVEAPVFDVRIKNSAPPIGKQ